MAESTPFSPKILISYLWRPFKQCTYFLNQKLTCHLLPIAKAPRWTTMVAAPRTPSSSG